jgi:PAS domain S-box-containing protein
MRKSGNKKPILHDADPGQGESSGHGIWKRLWKFLANWEPVEILTQRSKGLKVAVIDIFRRVPVRKLNSFWKRQWMTVSGSKSLEKLNSYLRTHGISAIPLPNGSMSLVRKISFASACVLFGIGLVLWTRNNILDFEKETVTKVNQYMSGVAREKGQCIEQSVQEVQDYISLLARKPFSGEFKPGQPLRYNDYVAGEALLEHVGGRVDSIYRLDSYGMVIYRVPDDRSTIGKDFSGTPGIKHVLENRRPCVSDVFEVYPGAPGFSVCHPVFDKEDFIGAICFMISLDTLNQSVCHIQNGSTGSIWIINQEGLIISHATPEFIGKNILDIEGNAAADYDRSEFERIVGDMMNGQEGHGVYRTAVQSEEKAEVIKKAAAFLPINLGDQVWSIAITMDYREIADPVKRHTRNNFLVATLVMLIFGVAGIVYYRNQKKKAELEVIARSANELRDSNEKLRLEIEQRIQAEKAREESESNYRLLAENVTDIIWIADLNLRLVYISPSVKRVLGFDPQQAIGTSIEEVLTPASLEVARDVLLEELAGEKREQKDKARARTLDMEIYREDGSTIWAETKISFLYDAAGTLNGLMGVTRDITEKMQLQNQFFQAQKMESIGTLAGGVAHDFNNLLAGMLGYATLIKMELEDDHKMVRYADTIETSARRAGELTGQLLAFARGGKYEPKVVSLNSVVGETLELIDRTFDKSIEIQVHLHDSIPTVEADAGQMQQVLMNLCVNARDAMDNKGTLTIKTDVETITEDQAKGHAERRPGSYVVLSVSDTGVGMDEDTANRIFEPFFTTKEKGKGTGLGLSMVYGVAKNHGGHVELTSKPGKGTTFKVYVPASGKTETKEMPKRRMVRGKSERILVVDDEEIARSLAKDTLESYGYQVLLAKDGVEAIEIYKENNGSLGLVIIDMVMPRMGGRETFLKLKELNREVKAILLTGYSQNEEANEILRSGVLGFIQKPFQLHDLLSKVRAVLDSKVVA